MLCSISRKDSQSDNSILFYIIILHTLSLSPSHAILDAKQKEREKEEFFAKEFPVDVKTLTLSLSVAIAIEKNLCARERM
jgi:hypothetical protein